jgi:hypothetical protein
MRVIENGAVTPNYLLIKHVQMYEKKTDCVLPLQRLGAKAIIKDEAYIYYHVGLSDAGVGLGIFAGNQIFIQL